MVKLVYYFAGYLLKFLLSLFGRLKVYNKHHLPQNEGYVVACTHSGWVDVLWLGVSILPVKVNYMAKKELFQSAGLKWLMEHLNAFPVDRDNPGPSTIKVPRKLLKEGKVIGIFPSGTRTSDEVPLKKGAVTIAATSKVALVPAAYAGPANLKELFQRKKPRLIFGEPIRLQEDAPKKMQVDIMMNEMNEQFKKLQLEINAK
ncbi:1-acyl-sn-glycerol-3-phosphate acyltransferase [Metabacillus sp. GX 13764]|uniref:lysophospholipid acyltransferase family protein n=1 Tax=Metabacillus kandeliae TaxID=2900151 RepID=UPI001E5914F6|nr:lysophospholipid acyltransferase family protein [Metabacillus kandeliae]MCD7035807.1 1-acyl-sn-glycerol-3-phosphate acyltransferase [Metabacillus kandeliae]